MVSTFSFYRQSCCILLWACFHVDVWASQRYRCRRGCLGLRGQTSSTLVDVAELLSISTSRTVYESSCCSVSSPTLGIIRLLHFANLIDWKVSHCGIYLYFSDFWWFMLFFLMIVGHLGFFFYALPVYRFCSFL